MHHLGLELEQEVFIFRVILGCFYNLAGKGFDRFKILSEGKCNKVCDDTLVPFEYMNAAIPFHRLVVRDGTGI